MTVRIKIKNVERAQAWCEENISKQEFYIHTMLGGQGWAIVKENPKFNRYYLAIDDDKVAVIAALIFSNDQS